MKKRSMLVLTSILTMILISSNLVACKGKKGDPVDYAGKYELTQSITSGIVMEGEELAVNYPGSDNYIEIVDSKNITIVMQGKKIDTTYTRDSNVLSIEDAAGPITFTLEGSTLTYSEGVDAEGNIIYQLLFTKS